MVHKNEYLKQDKNKHFNFNFNHTEKMEKITTFFVTCWILNFTIHTSQLISTN